jgi:hypothetical protein
MGNKKESKTTIGDNIVRTQQQETKMIHGLLSSFISTMCTEFGTENMRKVVRFCADNELMWKDLANWSDLNEKFSKQD